MTRFAPLLLSLLLALASSWTCFTPDKDFHVTLPFSAAHDVSTFSADGMGAQEPEGARRESIH
ncbi:hypothetical protein DYH09_30685 [bacterium CPR1]|nr:hypothetical protein [bacterium CPR1]